MKFVHCTQYQLTLKVHKSEIIYNYPRVERNNFALKIYQLYISLSELIERGVGRETS